MDMRASRSVAGRRVRISVAVVAALAVLALQPSPARADTFDTTFFPHHWGPNPYVAVPAESVVYRSIYLLDNTADPVLNQQIQYFANVINYLHVVYNSNYPVIFVFKNIFFTPGNPCAPGASQYLIVCKDEILGGQPAGVPGTAELTTQFANHIFNAVARFRPSVVDPWCEADKFTFVGQLISNTLGLDDNLTNPSSGMFATLPVGRCTVQGWTGAEFGRMNQIYNHAIG